jgi:hypothetical protein
MSITAKGKIRGFPFVMTMLCMLVWMMAALVAVAAFTGSSRVHVDVTVVSGHFR